ncbi:MAG: zinc carboxypeptidase [Anaerolineae bacterium]|nr:zinc carboxypeptidase [Anaerolineae bacterium]
MDLRAIAAEIPDYQVFLTIDELNVSSHQLVDEFPEVAGLRVVGETRRGDPIELLTVGAGPRQAFVFGGPHPNEPIGTMTIEYLSRRLCEDEALRRELGYTWHFIKSIDSDGMRLNEGWFKGPFTPTNYARHFFRPAPFDQVEWTFPIQYKDLDFNAPLPETQALMRVIDEVQPALLYSLHNAGFGGVYYYVSRQCEPLYSLYHDIPQWFGLALDLGEPEMSNAVSFAPAIYQMLSSRDTYDFLEENGVPDPAGTMVSGGSSAEYADRYGSFFLVVEMPYYDDPRVNDQSLTDVMRRDAILQNIDYQDTFDAWINGQIATVKDHLTLETLISRAVQSFLKTGSVYRQAERQWAQTSEETARPATQAELFSNLLGSRFYRMLILGMFARMMAEEIDAGNDAASIRAAMEDAQERLETQGAELESQLDYRALPIKSLVGVQACAGLATAAYLRDGG